MSTSSESSQGPKFNLSVPTTMPPMAWSVGAVSERLGVATPTLRTWERRYGLGPTHRTPGGHRRYTSVDIDRVLLTHCLVNKDTSASEAARYALSLSASELIQELRQFGPQTSDPVPQPNLAHEILQRSHAGDGYSITRLVDETLARLGAAQAWDQVIGPALQGILDQRTDGLIPEDTSWLAGAAIMSALGLYGRRHAVHTDEANPVLLSGLERGAYRAPLAAIEAALAEREINTIEIGSATPQQAIKVALNQWAPPVLVLWSSVPHPRQTRVLRLVESTDSEAAVVFAGPGWPATNRFGSRVTEVVERVCELLPAA